MAKNKGQPPEQTSDQEANPSSLDELGVEPPVTSSKKRAEMKPALKNRIDRLFLDIQSEVEEVESKRSQSSEIPDEKLPSPDSAEDLTLAASKGRETKPIPGLSIGRKGGTGPLGSLGPQPVYPDEGKGKAITESLKQPPVLLQDSPVSPAGRESVRLKTPVYMDARSGFKPNSDGDMKFTAMMAVPFKVTGEEESSYSEVNLQEEGSLSNTISGLGLLEVLDANPDRIWTEDERRLVEQVTDQLSLALENAALFQQTQNALAEVENRRQIADSLRQIANLVGASLEIREVVERLLDQLPNLIPFTRATIQLVQDGQRVLLGGRGYDVARALDDSSTLHRPIDSDPLINLVFVSQKPVVLSDTRGDPRWDSISATDQVLSWLAAPMVAAGEVVGFLLLDNSEPGAYSDETSELAMTFASQAAVAIRNARLFQQVQDSLAETDVLYQASAELNTAQTYLDILSILRKSSVVLKHPTLKSLYFCLFDRPWTANDRPDLVQKISTLRFSTELDRKIQNQRQEIGINAEKNEFPDDEQIAPTQRESIATWGNATEILFEDRPFVIENLASTSILNIEARKFLVGDDLSGNGRLLLMPLRVGGQWIGFLGSVYQFIEGMMQPGNPDVTLFNSKQLRSLEALASQAAVAIQNIRLYDETRRRAAQLETAAEIARDTSSTLALDILLNRAVNLIRDKYGFYHSSIFLIDETGRSAVVRESTGIAGQEMKRRGHSLPVGSQSVVGQVSQTGETIMINNVQASAIYRPNPLLPETKSELAIALKIGARKIGVLDVQSNMIDAFSVDDLAVLQVLADQLAVAVDNARSYELAQQAVAETAQRVQELSTIYELTQSISAAEMKTQEIGHIIAQRFVSLVPVDRVTVYLVENRIPDDIEPELRLSSVQLNAAGDTLIQFLRVLSIVGPRGDLSSDHMEMAIESYPYFEFLNSPRPTVLLADELNSPSQQSWLTAKPAGLSGSSSQLLSTSEKNQRLLRQAGLRSIILVPLLVKAQSIGVIELLAQHIPVNPDAALLNLMITLANAAAVALENANLYERQLQTAEQLREVDKLKSQFLANMSHELRTPLNSIIGFSRVILKGIDGPVSELQQQDLTAIHSAGNHLLQLINDVLDISKIEAGKMELAYDNHVNMGDLVTSAMSTAIGLTKDKPIKLIKQIEQDLPLIKADPTRIRQVLINFLSNAAKFTETGSITVSVAKEESLPPGIIGGGIETTVNSWLAVRVTDTGPGILKVDQAKLFMPFSQVDSSPTRKVGGTGLGLSISRLLIELHNGKIGVESEPGKGSTFFFYLPINIEQEKPPGGGNLDEQ